MRKLSRPWVDPSSPSYGSTARVRLLEAQPSLDCIEWKEGEEDPERGVEGGEEWKPLIWRCGLAPCDQRYRISSQGRLFSPHTGKKTKGFYARDTRWAAVRGAGLVDLLAAASLSREERVPPRVFEAYTCICSGLGVEEYARQMRVSREVAWSHYNLAAHLVQPKREEECLLRRVEGTPLPYGSPSPRRKAARSLPRCVEAREEGGAD